MNPHVWIRPIALLVLVGGATAGLFYNQLISSDAYMGLVGLAVGFYFRRDDRRAGDAGPPR